MALVILLGALVVHAPTATWDGVQITDNQATAIAAWNLGENGTWALSEAWEDIPWRSITPDGDVVTNRFPGAIAWGAAFYALVPGGPEPLRAHDIPYWPATLAAVIATALAIATMFLVLDGLVPRPVAIGACALLAFGTGTWTVSADSLFTHGPAQLGIALGLLGLRHDRLWLAGLGLGAAMTMRPQLGVVALVVGISLTVTRRSVHPALRVGLGAVPGVVALVAYSRILFERWVPIGGRSVDQINLAGGVARGGDAPNILENIAMTLGHPQRGILLYSPFLMVLLPGIRAAWRSSADWIRWAAVSGVVVMIVQLLSNPENFHGGDDFFGYRLPLEMLTLATPLLALAAQEWVWPRRLARQALAITALGAVAAFSLGATIADPRGPNEAEYHEMVSRLGPHGEGYDPGDAVGPDYSRPSE